MSSSPSESAQDALWRAMFESSEVMAGAFELLADDYRYILVNAKAAAFYGLSAEEMLGRTGRDLGIAESHLHRRLNTLRRCWDARATLTAEYPFDHKGREGWFLGTFSPIAGETVRVSFVLVDVTERKRVQQEVERQQTRLDLALNAAGLGLWEFDIRGDVIHWDPRTRELFGVGPEDAVDYATYLARLYEEDAPGARAGFEAALAGEGHGRFTLLHRARGFDDELRWVRGFGRVLFDDEGRPTRALGTVQDVTEEVENGRRQALMVAELNHRVKNNLATVQSLAAQTARRAQNLSQFKEDYEGRLMSLARTHDVLTQNSWTGAELSVLLARELATYDGRVQMGGPTVELDATRAVALAMIVHELSTNAAKYGALSTPGGRVEVVWSAEDGQLVLDWIERGGPTAIPSAGPGFGTRLIQRLATGDLRGQVEVRYAAEGAVVRLSAPLTATAGAA